ncbi:MAG: 50S ribosomal protein L35 [Planctomycetota bacterium]|nr:MAG: 50S ribosomal protein L35 [Planctomycetota bacterium]
MPKMKTKKALTKRFRLTKKGKVKRTRANRGHLMSGTPGKVRRRLRKARLCSRADVKRIRKALGG